MKTFLLTVIVLCTPGAAGLGLVLDRNLGNRWVMNAHLRIGRDNILVRYIKFVDRNQRKLVIFGLVCLAIIFGAAFWGAHLDLYPSSNGHGSYPSEQHRPENSA